MHSHRFQTGLPRNRPEKNTEHGSSIPPGNPWYRKRRNSENFLLLGTHRNHVVSHRKSIRIYFSCRDFLQTFTRFPISKSSIWEFFWDFFWILNPHISHIEIFSWLSQDLPPQNLPSPDFFEIYFPSSDEIFLIPSFSQEFLKICHPRFFHLQIIPKFFFTLKSKTRDLYRKRGFFVDFVRIWNPKGLISIVSSVARSSELIRKFRILALFPNTFRLSEFLRILNIFPTSTISLDSGFIKFDSNF